MPAVATPPNAPSPSKKFSTITGLSQFSKSSAGTATTAGTARQSVRGLFDAGEGASGAADGKGLGLTLRGSKSTLANGLGLEDGPWSVSVAEIGDKRASRKKPKPASSFTLYITTPTHNLTLTRSAAEIGDFDAKVREGQSAASTLPALPALPQASSPPTGRQLLQTISRTLSPGGNRTRGALSNLTAPGLGFGSGASSNSSSPKEEPASPPSPVTTQLATYLTTMANIPLVKRHKAWRRFIRVRSDDLESVRVERRVRKVRSDLAQHVKLSVAPTNTNVGLTPSQSDIGEELRTDDEPEERSLSGRSTSHSYNGARPDVPPRSTSVDSDRQGNAEASSSVGAASKRDGRKSPSFAGIPEEQEREKQHEEEAAAKRTADAAAAKDRRRRERAAREDRDKVTVDDFEMIRVLGKGCAGKVLLVRHRPTQGLYAMKSIHKRHVLAHQELQHTLTEQAVLKRMAKDVMDPFVVRLWWSFHDKSNLYLVMDFHPGGDLATQLSRWGRLGRDRARFYAAEIVEGVEGLHRAGVIYRDLKPENVLIGSDGHIILSDFGLSKEFPQRDLVGGSSTPPPGSPSRSHSSRDVAKGHLPHWMSSSEDAGSASAARPSRNRWADDRDVTTTFCGTAEYLAPEVIQGAAYSYEVDWWSFGTMLYEMLTGITPFWADTHADMYVRVLHDELVFPDDRVIDQDTKSILRGLLQRNPMLRMKEPRIKKHPYFSMIEWDHVYHKRYIPPYIPPINPLDETDTQNFDETFLDMQPVVHGADDDEELKGEGEAKAEEEAPVVEAVSKVSAAPDADAKSLFDGYSFRGRRDSEATASIISAAEEDVEEAAPAASGGAAEAAPSVAAPPPDEESEDEEAAARAAVAALDRLEREASGETSFSSPSNLSTSTRPTSAGPSSTHLGATDSDDSHGPPAAASSGKGRSALSVGGLPAHGTIAETDDEDDDWDMVDASGPIGTELNGGKGQNLFARGVVDTYRLLRRQESSRIPPSPSYGSSTTRGFNRLSRRRPSSKKGLSKPSFGNLASTSANSLASSNAARSGGEGASGSGAVTSTDDGPEKSTATPAASPAKGGAASSTATTPAKENGSLAVSEAGNVRQRRSGGGASPSLASSDDYASADRTSKQRLKKIKRFTTFFETAR